MKKLIQLITITISLILSFGIVSPICLAAGPESPVIPTIITSAKDNNNIKQLNNLPQGQWQYVLGNIIKFVLKISGSLALISFTMSGINMVTAGGSDDKLKKGKTGIYWSIIALIIIGISYSIVVGITNVKIT